MNPGLRFMSAVWMVLSLLAGLFGWISFDRVKNENLALTARLDLTGKVDKSNALQGEGQATS